jgi:hypothetical protein
MMGVMNYESKSKIGEGYIVKKEIEFFLKNRVKGMYWGDDAVEELVKDLKLEFGDEYSDSEWEEIARDVIDPHYS